jgi:steroid 5-alpha reductase family enzyme
MTRAQCKVRGVTCRAMSMTPLEAFLISAVIAVAAKALAWVVQLRTRNAGMVDPIWAATLATLAVFYAAVGHAPVSVRVAIGVMGGLWGMRLAVHLFVRNWGKAEDWRYAKFRAEWGERADYNMFWFFQFQNVFTLMLAASAFLTLAFRLSEPPPVAFALAALVWIVSVAGEALSDRQMERFRADPANRGKVCRSGLWRWSRHPNYFFECLHWCAYVVLAWGMAGWGWTLLAPLVMAFLLLKLSGMPLMEAEMIRRKPDYADYVRTTSALIPLPPRTP